MAQERKITFVTAEIPAGSSLDHNEKIPFNQMDILKLKVSPSILGGTAQVHIYERDTFLVANLIYGSNPFVGNEFDPVQIDNAGVVSEAVKGFIVPYTDKDMSRELHIKLVNNDAQAKMFTIDITYRLPNVFAYSDPIVKRLSINSVVTNDYTMLAADINGGLVVHVPTNAGTITTDTAANIIKACSLSNDGDSIEMWYVNASAVGKATLRIIGGVGVTMVITRDLGRNRALKILFARTSPTTVSIYSSA